MRDFLYNAGYRPPQGVAAMILGIVADDVTGMRVWQKISPGLPSCLSLTEPPRLLVLKSGRFGAPDFFLKALVHLRAW